jgi:hypothetical protein
VINLPPITVTAEVIEPNAPDLLDTIRRHQTYAIIKAERARLASIYGDEVAWMAFPPTPDDNPAEWEPYWMRLKDAVPDEVEREAIVAAWLNGNRT